MLSALVMSVPSRPRALLETATLFLAAPATTYVTGAIICVDGGWSAW